MKRVFFLVVFVCIFLYCTQGFPQNNFDICSCKSSDVNKEYILLCLVGYLQMYPENIEGAKRVVICAIEQWEKRDGAIGKAISDAFLAMMEMNPTIFFDEMAKNQRIFSEWLNKLEPYSFTSFKKPPSLLEDRRKKLIEFLSKFGPLPKQEDILRQKLVSVLRTIKVRQVK